MSKSATRSSSRFYVEGHFLGFASGKKSPFKYIRVMTETQELCIKLKKPLQLMLFRYLVPGDWIRVVGSQKWDKDSEELMLKADEVVRATAPTENRAGTHETAVDGLTITQPGGEMGTPNVKTLQPLGVPVEIPAATTSKSSQSASSQSSRTKPIKVLICQKSGCRKRGGTAVGEMVERSLCQLGLSDNVTVKYTGCMDRCKAGPNLVFMPGKAKYSRVEPGMVPDLVRQHCTES